MKLKSFPATLKNGTSVLIREVTRDDRHLLQIGFQHLSDRAKYFRFLGAHKNLSERELDKFTATNGPDHVAVGALLNGGPIPEPIGIARYIRLPDQNHIAEIAITIADSHQHQGLGSLLLGVLAKFAQLDGISEFNALVHNENTAMLGLLNQFRGAQTALGGVNIEVRIPVSNISAHGSKSTAGNALGDIYIFADTCETLAGPTQKMINQKSAKLRQIVNFHPEESDNTGPDQPTSVWENEGGAIEGTAR